MPPAIAARDWRPGIRPAWVHGAQRRAGRARPRRLSAPWQLHLNFPDPRRTFPAMPFRGHMDAALAQARLAAGRGEVPVGAVVTDAAGHILAAAGNETETRQDPTAHAEVLAIRAACMRAGTPRLPPGTVLTVTLEPCAMCAGAIAAARIDRLVFGAADPKSGGVIHGARVLDRPQAHHRVEVIGGIAEADCAALLTGFFAARRR